MASGRLCPAILSSLGTLLLPCLPTNSEGATSGPTDQLPSPAPAWLCKPHPGRATPGPDGINRRQPGRAWHSRTELGSPRSQAQTARGLLCAQGALLTSSQDPGLAVRHRGTPRAVTLKPKGAAWGRPADPTRRKASSLRHLHLQKTVTWNRVFPAQVSDLLRLPLGGTPQVRTDPGPLLYKKPSRSEASPGHQPALLHQLGAHTCPPGVAHLPVSTTQEQCPAGANKELPGSPGTGPQARSPARQRIPASAGPTDKAPSWKPVGEVAQVLPSRAGDQESPRPSDANHAGHRRDPRQHWLATSCSCLPPPPSPCSPLFLAPPVP